MRVFMQTAAVITLLAASQFAQATPINYDEAVNGDIESFRDAMQTLNFDVGANRITGNATTGFGPVDFDVFRFVIPEFMQLDSVILQYGDYQSTGGLIGFGSEYTIWNDYFGPNPQSLQNTDEITGTYYNVLTTTGPQSLFTILPLGPGEYDWAHSLAFSYIGERPDNAYANWDYSLTFNVSSTAPVGVPEPGTISLILASGLMLAIAVRRKKLPAAELAA